MNDDKSEKIKFRHRTNQINIRVNDIEHMKFIEMQKHTGLSASQLIRQWINEQPVHSTTDIQAVNEMRRQGGLLKHSAYSLMNKNIISEELANELLTIAQDMHSVAKGITNRFLS